MGSEKVKDTDRAKMRGSIPYYGASGIVDYVNKFLFDDELILLGEDGENIVSRTTRLAFRINGKAWVNNHAHVIKPNPDMSIGFLCDYLESLNYEQYNSGTAQPKLNKQTCNLLPIAVPPNFADQEAIAEALTDADTWVESLERLIAKKRQIKQGVMQELLTADVVCRVLKLPTALSKLRFGKLPNDWDCKSLLDVCRFRGGKAHEQYISQSGKYICVTQSYISTDGKIRKYSNRKLLLCQHV